MDNEIKCPGLKVKTDSFFDTIRAMGQADRIVEYDCPNCGMKLPTIAQSDENQQPWDTLSFCYGCGRAHWKVTKGRKVTTELIS